MKIVNIIGGLGNQMFQYALLVGLRETFKEKIYTDISGFSNYHLHNGVELEQIFPIVLEHNSREIPHIKKLTLSRYMFRYFPFLCRRNQYEYPDFRYNENVFIENKADCYYSGYWHNYRYVEPFRNILLKEFTFKKPLSEVSRQIAEKLLREDSIGIHVRRGDYLKEKQYQGICELTYYERAIKLLKDRFDKPSFYVFSNDMDWCKDNLESLTGKDNTVYVDWNRGTDSYQDMQLMTYCKGLIIANSSFSWWGAFLNQVERHIIIAPKRWKNTNYNLEIQLPEWTLI